MPRCLHKRGILRVGHFIAIDQKLVEVNPPLRLLIKPAPIGPEDETAPQESRRILLQEVPQRRPAQDWSSLILFRMPVEAQPQTEWRPSREESR
jgi:hypothetical protein